MYFRQVQTSRENTRECSTYSSSSVKWNNKFLAEGTSSSNHEQQPMILQHSLLQTLTATLGSGSFDGDLSALESSVTGSEEEPSGPSGSLQSSVSTCTLCSYKAASSDHLARHMSLHQHQRQQHQSSLIPNVDKPFSCPVCSYRCNRKAHLQQHIRIHTGEKPFQCSYCSYRTNNKSNLKTHEFAQHKLNQQLKTLQ